MTDGEGLCKEHLLDSYKVLIIPDNDCYEMNPDSELETKIRTWCEQGGIVLYGPNCAIAKKCFGVEAYEHQPDAIHYQEDGMVRSREFCTYPEGKKIASYLSDNASCVTQYETGKGYQYAFGFSYGYAYNTEFVPHVPMEHKKHELYPLEMMKRNILGDIVKNIAGIEVKQEKRIERAYFENGEIIINHTSYPYEVGQEGEKIFRYRECKIKCVS